MAGPPEDKQAGQQNLSKHGQHAMDGGDAKTSQESNPNDPGFKYSPLGDDKSNKTNKEVYGQARNNSHGDQHGGAEYTGATSSYYKVSIDELRNIHKQLKDMVDAADQDRDQARRIRDVDPPAEDQEGSLMHAKALSQWGKRLHDQAQQHYKALLQYKNNIGDIIDTYSKSEHDATVTFRDFEGKL